MTLFETRRTVLFAPGDNERRLTKALTLGADTICYDLEDAVAPDAKEVARETVRRVLRDIPPPDHGPERCVRINPVTTRLWEDDLRAAMDGKPDAIMIPKAEDGVGIAAACELLAAEERRLGIQVGQTRVLLVVETAAGIFRARDVGEAAGARLGALLFGAEDLAADAGLVRTREATEVLAARSLVALSAATLRVGAVDMVWADIADTAGLETEARFGRTLGYGGKMVIHPDQIAPAHRAFTPTPAEIDYATRLLEAAASQPGAFRFEGRMIDNPLLMQARRTLRTAERAGLAARAHM